MAEKPLCRYCSKSMEIESVDYYGTEYKCDCVGFVKEQELKKAISKLKDELNNKEDELRQHKGTGDYYRIIGKYQAKIRKAECDYNESC